MSELADSYARCEAITREQAANFYYGIRLLAGERRRALCAAYAFARRIDDIGDGDAAARAEARGSAQAEAHARELAVAGAATGDPVMVALADATRAFAPHRCARELIEGVRMDVREA